MPNCVVNNAPGVDLPLLGDMTPGSPFTNRDEL